MKIIRWIKHKYPLLFLKFLVLGLLVFVGNCFSGHAQNLLLYEVAGIPPQMGKKYFSDSLSSAYFLQELLVSLQLEGYPTAFVRSKTFYADTLEVKLERGEAFRWVGLRKGNLNENLAARAGFVEEAFTRQYFDFHRLKTFFDKVLDEAQNTGYPFATIRLDSLIQREHGISAALNFENGPYITFDSLEISGNSKTKPAYLSRLLGLTPSAAFSQAKVDQSIRLVQKLPYIRLVGEPQLSFQNRTAKVSMPINDRPINTLDGIIGLLPNENGGNKLLVTGQFDLALYNVAGRGRNYHLQWQRLSQHSQNLTLAAEEPMVLGSLIDLELSFNLLKEDTTFLNRDFRLGLGYRISPEIYMSFFSRRKAGDLLSVSPGYDLATLPDVVDFRLNNYGMNLLWNDLDDPLSPRNGWLSELEFAIGNKRLLQNTALPPSAYDALEMSSMQYYLVVSLERLLQFSSSFGALISLSGGEMANRTLFLNELFRLGGLKNIRGFNENFFFAKRYVYANFEPRFYFDNYSYFLLFLDVGGLQGNGGKQSLDRPLSFGAGVSLDTGQGVFNFIYALGKSNTQLLGFNFSKIHFGYTGRF